MRSHAPPRGVGDGDDLPHHGFSCYHGLVAALRPIALLHGHVQPQIPPVQGWRVGATIVRNVTGRHMIDISNGSRAASSPGSGPDGPQLDRTAPDQAEPDQAGRAGNELGRGHAR